MCGYVCEESGWAVDETVCELEPAGQASRSGDSEREGPQESKEMCQK